MTTKPPTPNGAPDSERLLERITSLVEALDRVVGHTTDPIARPTPPPTPAPVDEERVRRQAIVSLRYDIVSGLLGRTGVVPPFAPARRDRQADNRIEFTPKLPADVGFVVFRSAGSDGATQKVTSDAFTQQGQSTVVGTGAVGGAPLQPIEVYDTTGRLVRLGPDLPARASAPVG